METMDTIHCYFLHTFDIGFRLKSNDIYNIMDEKKNDENDDDDEICEDSTIVKLSNFLKSKRQKLRNIRGVNLMNNNKFITNIGDNIKNKNVSMNAPKPMNNDVVDDDDNKTEEQGKEEGIIY